MTKEQLYEKLMNAYCDHRRKDTYITTYTDRILRIVKKYLNYDEIKKDLENAKKEIDKSRKVLNILNVYLKYYSNEVDFDTYVTSQLPQEEQELMCEVSKDE